MVVAAPAGKIASETTQARARRRERRARAAPLSSFRACSHAPFVDTIQPHPPASTEMQARFGERLRSPPLTQSLSGVPVGALADAMPRSAPPNCRPGGVTAPEPAGLSSADAGRRLTQSGANAIAEVRPHPLRLALGKLWAPVPWMLEAAIVLQLGLGDDVGAGVIALLLVFNAGLGLVQEGRAQATVDALKSRLALVAAVRRDGAWTTVRATELVVGDIVKLSARHGRRGRCPFDRWLGPPRPVDADRGGQTRSKPAPGPPPLPAPWCAAAKRWPRS